MRTQRLWEWGVAVGLVVMGSGLWNARVTVPGAMVVIPKIRPRSVAFSSDGAWYVADGYYGVRKVGRSRIITTEVSGQRRLERPYP